MLERKRVLKQVKTEYPRRREARPHLRTGLNRRRFVVPDPQLRLDELETVQNEVAEFFAELRKTDNV